MNQVDWFLGYVKVVVSFFLIFFVQFSWAEFTSNKKQEIVNYFDLNLYQQKFDSESEYTRRVKHFNELYDALISEYISQFGKDLSQWPDRQARSGLSNWVLSIVTKNNLVKTADGYRLKGVITLEKVIGSLNWSKDSLQVLMSNEEKKLGLNYGELTHYVDKSSEALIVLQYLALWKTSMPLNTLVSNINILGAHFHAFNLDQPDNFAKMVDAIINTEGGEPTWVWRYISVDDHLKYKEKYSSTGKTQSAGQCISTLQL